MELLGGLNMWMQGARGPETDLLLALGTAAWRLRLGVRGEQWPCPRGLRAASVRPRSSTPSAGSTAPRWRGSGRRPPLGRSRLPRSRLDTVRASYTPGGVGGKLLDLVTGRSAW